MINVYVDVYVYVDMFVYTYKYVYIYIYLHTHIQVYVHKPSYIARRIIYVYILYVYVSYIYHSLMYTYIHIHTYASSYACICTCMYMYMYMCILADICGYIARLSSSGITPWRSRWPRRYRPLRRPGGLFKEATWGLLCSSFSNRVVIYDPKKNYIYVPPGSVWH